MRPSVTELIGRRRLYFDGGCGTILQAKGLKPGEAPEEWNLSHPDVIRGLHTDYLAAGADMIKTNTFGANRLKDAAYREHIAAAMQIAKEAVSAYPDAYIAFDVGPTGKLLEPLGPLSFEDAVAAFSDSIALGASLGADLVLIETMNDAYETKAAVVAAKSVCKLPVFVTNAYDASCKLMTGADPETMAAILEGLGADAIGMNCSVGPELLLPAVKRLRAATALPIIVNPNAGLPRMKDGVTDFALSAEDFARSMCDIAEAGADILGGCCGTTPDYIARTIRATKDIPLTVHPDPGMTVVSSYTHTVTFGKAPVLIGERINPTGKPKCKEALRKGDTGYILSEGLKQADCGVQMLDVNAGLPDIDEAAVLTTLIKELQGVTDLPLQLDSSDPEALGAAMRIYNGKPLVNSVSGKETVMDAVFPLIKKYGGAVIALTLDDNGIPKTAEERVGIAERIIARAAEYGIPKKDIIVDPLALTVSADPESADVTLEAVRLLREKGICTSLGVSNISFGLPVREIVNSTFFAQALGKGLSAAIMNPFSRAMMDVYHAHCALHGYDAGCADYIAYTETRPADTAAAPAKDGAEKKPAETGKMDLHTAIVRGVRGEASVCAKAMLASEEPLSVIDKTIIPALNEVGAAFETKKLFLPQLIGAADAASEAFAAVREALAAKSDGKENGDERPFILATVHGDIHDIGKNIVKVLLESYGFAVKDLGKDVPPETVLEAVKETGCRIVGLSALMTTTVPAMEETVHLLHEYDSSIRIVVGGAVMTAEDAARIGADAYSADAMETVRYAKAFYGKA